MNKKLLIASFAAAVVLLAIAGVIELLLLVLPASSENVDAPQPPEIQAEIESPDAELFATQGDSSSVAEGEPSAVEARAAELVKADCIVFDGDSLSREQAEALVAAAKPFNDNVEYVDQRPILPSGCEIVALAVALRAEGYDADPVAIADGHVRYGNDFETEYVGSPRVNGEGFPPCIVDAGNSWLKSEKATARAVNLTDTTFQGVLDLVELGYPVLVWTTEGMIDPDSRGVPWSYYEHCVVVCGLEDNGVLVADSLAGKVVRDRAAFERLYEGFGCMAALVVPE